MSYLNELKIAVINKDIEKLLRLANQEPQYNSLEEAKEILSYINQARDILYEAKAHILKEMNEIKKLQKYYKEQEKTTFNSQG